MKIISQFLYTSQSLCFHLYSNLNFFIVLVRSTSVNTLQYYRYPFHGAEHSGLFAKIRRGQFNLPDSLSSRAKCLIRSLLKKEPEERLTTEDVLVHPWLTGTHRERGTVRRSPHIESTDHCVPEFSSAPAVQKFDKVFRLASESEGGR